MAALRILLFTSALLAGIVSADNELSQAGQQFGAGFKSLGQLVVSQYNKVSDFLGSTKQELEKKVKDTADFLSAAKQNMDSLKQDAIKKGDKALQDALDKVNSYYQDVNNFQAQVVATADANMQQLEDQWKQKVTSMYNGGLNKVIEAANEAKTGGSATIQINAFLLSSALLFFVVKMLVQ